METVNRGTLMFQIIEYGDVVVQYNDANYERFIRVTTEMVKEYMLKSIKQDKGEVKNCEFKFYTY